MLVKTNRRKDIYLFYDMEVYMKQHRFWAYASVICMLMAMYTGYKHR